MKSSEFDSFIKNLSDHEFVIFVSYRYNGFLQKSKEKLKKEIKKRSLSPNEIEIYRSKKVDHNSEDKLKICLRCGSEKLFVETDFEENPICELSSVEISIDTYRCRLCGYNPDKETPKNLFGRVWRLFRNNRRKRIINWNSF